MMLRRSGWRCGLQDVSASPAALAPSKRKRWGAVEARLQAPPFFFPNAKPDLRGLRTVAGSRDAGADHRCRLWGQPRGGWRSRPVVDWPAPGPVLRHRLACDHGERRRPDRLQRSDTKRPRRSGAEVMLIGT